MTWGAYFLSHGWQFLLQAALLAASAFFNASETALFSLSRSQIMQLKGSGAAGRLVAALVARPRRLLNSLLLGNMLVTTAYSAIAALAVVDLTEMGLPAPLAAAMSLAPLVALILLSEVGPKLAALALGPRLAIVVAPVAALAQEALSPVLWLLQAGVIAPLTRMLTPPSARGGDVTTRELAALLNLSARRGILTHDANVLLQEILELKELRVGDIMVPRVDMIAFEAAGTGEQLLELFRKTHLRRVPVYDGNLDNILGLVHAKRVVLVPTAPVRTLVTKAPFVPVVANLERVLLQFRVTRTQMAIVVDEYGGTAGMVTLEDVLEEIVGDIPDPHHVVRHAPVQRLSDREYILAGNLGIHEWPQALKIQLPSHRISTVGGFVTSLLGHIPKVGEQAAYRNLLFTVQAMRGRRIESLRLQLLEGRP